MIAVKFTEGSWLAHQEGIAPDNTATYTTLGWLRDGKPVNVLMTERQWERVVSDIFQFEWVRYNIDPSHILTSAPAN